MRVNEIASVFRVIPFPDEEYEIKLTREHIYNPYVVESYDDKPIFSLLLFYFQAFFIAYCVYMSKQYERIRPKE